MTIDLDVNREKVARLQTAFLRGDKAAGWEIVEMYRPFIRSQVKTHLRFYSLDVADHFDDLFAYMQLEAFAHLKSFDPKKGTFGTFVRWHLQNASREYARSTMSGARLSQNAWRDIRALRRVYKEYEAEGKSTTLEALSEGTGFVVSKLRALMPMLTGPLVSEAPTMLNEDGEVIDFFDQVDAQATPVLDTLIADDERALFQAAVDELSPREAHIIRARYPGDSLTPVTLSELGEHYGVTRERIRQIEVAALKKVRKKISHILLLKEAVS